MKKSLISALLFISLLLAARSSALAVSCTPVSSVYPAALDTFVANNCIPSGWANQLEQTIGATNSGVTSSITYQLNQISTQLITSSPIFYINGARTDSYTPNGSYALPFKTISSAIASSTGFSGYAYNLYPGTYVDGPPDTFSTSPFLINGNESTFVTPSGATLPGSFDIYDLTWVGNVTESDNSLTFIHQFNNGVITGNLTLAGLALLNGMAFPTTTSTISALQGSLVNIVGSSLNGTVQSSGTLNIDDDALIGSSSQPLVNSTAGTANMLGVTLINTGSGGGIVINNGATSTPNNINSVSIVVNSSTSGSTIKTGSAATVVCNVTGLTNLAGTFIAPSGTNFPPCYDESRAVLNAFSVGTSTQPSSGTLLSGTINLPSLAINSFLATDANHNLIATGTPAGGTGGGANNATGTVNSGAVFSGANTLVSNTMLYVPTNFATAGCAGNSGATDFGTCVNALYNSVSSTASSVVIMVPNINVTQAQWKQPINFATNQLIPSLVCPGGAQLHYGGTSTAVTFNFNVSGAHDVSQDWGCTYLGNSSVITAGQSNAATTTGVLFGGTTGSNAANGVHFHDNVINGFGSCMDVATNTYMLAITNNAISGCGSSANQPYPGSLLTFNKASNSGEREVVTGNSFTDPANSTSVNAVYLSDNGNNSTFFSNNSFDDVQIYVGISQAIVDIEQNHFEDASPSNYSGYYFIVASSSGATTLNVNDNLFAIDSNSSASQSKGIEEAVNFSFNHNEVNRYGNQAAITNFINHDINAGQAVEEACNNWSQNSAVSNWMQLTGTTYPGCFYENANSYPITITTTGGSLGEIINGQQNVGTFDSNGNWNFLKSGMFGGTGATPSTTIQATGASSTIRAGSNNNASHGCLELYDAVNSSTLMYIYSSSSVLIDTSTKPTFCQ